MKTLANRRPFLTLETPNKHTMKQFLLIIVAISISMSTAFGQHDMSKVFDKDSKLVWYGLDFTQAKMVGHAGFSDPYKIVNYYFTNWNELVNTEYEKYDVRKVMHRRDMIYNVDAIRNANQDVDSGDLVHGHTHKLDDSNIASCDEALKTEKDEDGVGMMMVVESFDKPAEKGTYHVVFFDIQSKDVIKSTKLTGAAGGFGFRNYWARTFKEVLEKIERHEYRKWRK